jgi:hypothetical protein
MNMTDLNVVKALIGNIRHCFNTPQGEEVMKFLEVSCGWYESVFDPTNRDAILVNAGRREVVATIKTLLKNTPEEIVALAAAQQERGE